MKIRLRQCPPRQRCLLEQLESLASSRGEKLSLNVSGRVTVHNGCDYLLPTMYQIIRLCDITPMQ